MRDIKKVCEYCCKEFVIAKELQEQALEKGGNLNREYCNECLLRWKKGEIDLDNEKHE